MAEPEADRTLPQIDWETFYADYRRPGFVPGYEILQKLGAGAFGIVFKARKQSIGKDYAIKFLKVDDVNVRDAVLHELGTVKLFAQVDHPNLVTIEDMGQAHGIPYIVMGYAGEETLAKRLAAGSLPRAEAIRLFTQVCRGVEALHGHMLVHFDLKPANVYIKGEVARVGDYGLSKMVTASRRSLSFGRGTTYYMAPEVLHRKGDHRSDIYSLGVMLYECLVGRVPFQGETEWEILKKHEAQAPEYPATLSASDRTVLEACLHKNPDARVQEVGGILAMLQGTAAPLPAFAAAASTPPSSRGAVAAPPSGAPRKRSATRLALIGVVLSGLAITFFTAPRRPRRFPAPDATTASEAPARVTPRARPSIPTKVTAPAATATPTAADAEFRNRLDEAIAALQRLKEIDVARPDVGDKAVSALGKTIAKFEKTGFRGQDPVAETLVQALRAGITNPEVRQAWGELIDSVMPKPPPPTRR
jgi:hypothetical protein